MIISIIAAIGKNNEIGYQNNLLWHLPADLQRFKELTLNHPIVMGRKTFESLPKGALPNRKNIVISRNPLAQYADCLVFSSIDEALIKLRDEKEVYIIGGFQIYDQTLPFADKLYLTKVSAEFPEADVFFPAIQWDEWKKASMETHPADEKNKYSFTFFEYERIR